MQPVMLEHRGQGLKSLRKGKLPRYVDAWTSRRMSVAQIHARALIFISQC